MTRLPQEDEKGLMCVFMHGVQSHLNIKA